MREITITANDAGRRLDRFLRKYLKEASLGEIYKFIRKDVKVDGKRCSESYILKEGNVLSLYLSDDALISLSGGRFAPGYEDAITPPVSKALRNFDLVYEDEQILIANKSYGLLTHGDRNEKKDHLANRVKDYLIASGAYNPRAEKVFTPAPVNRLDRNTTGIVLFGKTAEAMRELTRIIRENEISKFYLTIACGEIMEDLHLGGSIIKDEASNKVRVIQPCSAGSHSSDNSKTISTEVRPLEVLDFGIGYQATLCEVELITGRSHQIRAHLSSAGYPLIGDGKYALRKYTDENAFIREATGLSTQLLHAYRIVFSERISGSGCLGYLSEREFKVRSPKRFRDVYGALGGMNTEI